MNVRFPALLLLLGVLGGCASVEDVTGRDPVFFGSTARTSADYVQCVDSAWKGQGVTAERKPIHNGYELVVHSKVSVEAVLTVTTWKEKTDATLHTRIARNSTTLAEAANLCL